MNAARVGSCNWFSGCPGNGSSAHPAFQPFCGFGDVLLARDPFLILSLRCPPASPEGVLDGFHPVPSGGLLSPKLVREQRAQLVPEIPTREAVRQPGLHELRRRLLAIL